jgi:hypothetical protein
MYIYMFEKLLGIINGINIIRKPKFIIYYGNFGGGGYTGKTFYDKKTGTLYKISESKNIVKQEDITPDQYIQINIDNIKTCEPVDYIDACFKLHDIDSVNLDFFKIVRISNVLFKNITQHSALLYGVYPIFLPATLLYYYTVGITNYTTPEFIVTELDSIRQSEKEKYSKLYDKQMV